MGERLYLLDWMSGLIGVGAIAAASTRQCWALHQFSWLRISNDQRDNFRKLEVKGGTAGTILGGIYLFTS